MAQFCVLMLFIFLCVVHECATGAIVSDKRNSHHFWIRSSPYQASIATHKKKEDGRLAL
jgi:hypothetical protein